MTELCIKCGKYPVYEYKGKVGVICAKCFLLALADLMAEELPGDTEADRKEVEATVAWLREAAK